MSATSTLRYNCLAEGCKNTSLLQGFCYIHACNASCYWWDGEYEGTCDFEKGHKQKYHYDGVSYFNDDNEELFDVEDDTSRS